MTSIPPSSISSASAASAPAAPTGQPNAVLTQLPGAQPPTPGTVITGTVLSRDAQGQVLLQTDSGVVAFKTAALLTVGSQVSLQIQAVGSQLQAVILSALAAGAKGTAATLTPGRSPAGSGTAAAAPATTIAPSVSAGAVVTATVIGPSGGPVPATTSGPPAAAAQPPSGGAPGSAAQAAAPAASRTTLAGASPLPSTPGPAAPGATAAPTTPSALVAQQSPAASPPGVSAAVARYAAAPGTVTTGSTPPAPAPTPAASTPSAAGTSPGNANPTTPQGHANPPSLQPAASGTTLQIRLGGAGAPATQGSTPVTGTLVAHTANGQTLIDTPVGRLTLSLPGGIGRPPLGSSIALEILSGGGPAAANSLAAATGGAKPLPTLGQDWPTLKTAIAALASIDPSFARQIVDNALPRLGTPRFLSQLLGQLLTGGGPADSRTLLGDTALALLQRAGRHDVLAALDRELQEMNRLNSSASDWRVMFLPLADPNELRQLRVYTRKKKGDKDKGRERSGRFVVEVEFDEYGPLQIDGLVQKPRIDLIVRSHVEFAPGMQAGIAEVFGRTCDASGLIGKIFFHASPQFPVSPMDEITQAGPGLSV